ncbi:unnamed protein product [Rhizoctonia solani]|uniref:Uncharacterized protein n=1 Tax=Rhizoctonia solani TaxID=456999 RepID=A0A8H3B0G3_9AGAM|nr:unnamed protein product [Rhizoctonia solani]
MIPRQCEKLTIVEGTTWQTSRNTMHDTTRPRILLTKLHRPTSLAEDLLGAASTLVPTHSLPHHRASVDLDLGRRLWALEVRHPVASLPLLLAVSPEALPLWV